MCEIQNIGAQIIKQIIITQFITPDSLFIMSYGKTVHIFYRYDI